VAVAALLLPLSDVLIYRLWPAAPAGSLSFWKGVAFILVSAVLLYFERRRSESRFRAMRETVERQAAELEARVKDRTAELEKSQAELEAFSYSVSHDLRAPLRAVEGFSQALLEDYGELLDATGRDYASRLVGAAHNMDALIRDLIAYSRLSRAEMPLGAVNLGEAVADALKAMEAEVLETKARVAVEPDMPSVIAHPTTLVQVILNLLRNAVKFMPAGEIPRVKVYASPQSGKVRLYVRDNGIGIDPRHQERIFLPFERLHGADAFPGTGIGLSIVQRGVERMGGRVGVISEIGEGSRFWIELKSA
jgi:signal transduction histidine kinase